MFFQEFGRSRLVAVGAQQVSPVEFIKHRIREQAKRKVNIGLLFVHVSRNAATVPTWLTVCMKVVPMYRFNTYGFQCSDVALMSSKLLNVSFLEGCAILYGYKAVLPVLQNSLA